MNNNQHAKELKKWTGVVFRKTVFTPQGRKFVLPTGVENTGRSPNWRTSTREGINYFHAQSSSCPMTRTGKLSWIRPRCNIVPSKMSILQIKTELAIRGVWATILT